MTPAYRAFLAKLDERRLRRRGCASFRICDAAIMAMGNPAGPVAQDLFRFPEYTPSSKVNGVRHELQVRENALVFIAKEVFIAE